MRRAAKIDDNQPEIVDFFRGAGASVAITSAVGQGFSDIVIGYRGITALVEIKDGSKPPCERQLTAAQVKFSSNWKGSYHIVESIKDCLAVLQELDAQAKGIDNQPPLTNT